MGAASGPSDRDSGRRSRGYGATGDGEDVTGRDRTDHTGDRGDRTDATRRDTVPPEGARATDATRVDTRPRQSAGSGPTEDPTADWIHVPTVITERYQVIKALPAGGEALGVRHVKDRLDGSEWVVKLYRGSLRRNVPVMTALKEADHPHVVRVRDFGSERDTHGIDWPWEVLEYVPGGSLDGRLTGHEALPEADVRAVLAQLTEALHYLHNDLRIGDGRGAAHRDVKPANILLRRRNGPVEAVLADFGLVAETRETRQTDLAAGSWMYQAPETFYRADRRSAQDWWSLGVVVVRMLTGRNPNDGGAGGWSGPQALFEYLTTHDVDLSGVADARWRQLCAGLLTRAPEHRWGREQVRVWLNGGSPEVHSAPTTQPVGKPLGVNGETYYDLASLAEAMAESAWPVSRSPFLSAEWLGSLRGWLEREFNGGGIPGELVEQPAEDARAAAVRAAAFRAAVLKRTPPRFAGHPADAAGLSALAASSAPEDRQVVAVISGDLLHVLASHPCATPTAAGHRRCGSRCRVLANAAETLPEVEARLGREITDLRSRVRNKASAGLADALRGLHQDRELRVLCLRGVLDPAGLRRLRWNIRTQRGTSKLRSCAWWMELSATALRDRDSPARLLLAQVLLPVARADGHNELRKPGGRRERWRTEAMRALSRARAYALRLSADLVTAALLFCTSLVVLYVAVVAWFSWSGDRPETDLGRYASTAVHLQYTLSVPLAAVLLSLVLLQAGPAPAARFAAWCVVASGVALAVTLWNGHGGDIRFPYLPGANLKDSLLELETQPGIGDHPGTAACVAAAIATACLIGIAHWAEQRPARAPGRYAASATWARALTVLVVLALLIGPAFDWWPPALVPTETKELW
ncbi:serine/threonine-protein kinase [Streptomyces sp. NPDC002935]|uniref:serine/threonine-protein kinase n=1 Tax=unclassified Streptomyces TaxID=2593676 RepID=UPI003320D88A